MYSEEETELRDVIVQNLENCGFLNKIKAELRAGVFLALEEDGNLKTKIQLLNEKFDEFSNTQHGKFVISLIREFLEFYTLNFTLSVFDPETSSSVSHIPRSELCDQLNLKSSEIDEPVLSWLLKDGISRRAITKTFDERNVSEKIVNPLFNDAESCDVIRESFSKADNSEKSTFSLNNDSASIPKDVFNDSNVVPSEEIENNKAARNTLTDILKNKNEENDKDKRESIFKDSNDLQTLDHDPFFDEPLPSEKTFFTFSDPLKGKVDTKLCSSIQKESLASDKTFISSAQEKTDNKLTSSNAKDADEAKKSSLSSLKDLPSLNAGHEWTFSRDTKSLLPSIDSNKSVSSSEASNEEIINLDPKESPKKRDSEVSESNEESSEKQNSEESIEEEIEEDFSAGFDDLLNSSLSLADDATTDQTVSQVSAVEDVDHVEPCN